MKEQITYDIFDKVDIRVGTVISVKQNEKARKKRTDARNNKYKSRLKK